MLHWLHSLLPHIPHYGYVLVFLVVFLNNVGVPLPGETILLGAGFVLGKNAISLWQPVAAGIVACFLGGICSFWLGRRLGHGRLEKIHWLHLTGSAAYTTTYILIGYFFGKKWKQLEAWLGPTALYLIFAGIILIVLGVIFRHSLSKFSMRHFSKKTSTKT
jgi:membrane protein DedA with SNARE-associated domain